MSSRPERVNGWGEAARHRRKQITRLSSDRWKEMWNMSRETERLWRRLVFHSGRNTPCLLWLARQVPSEHTSSLWGNVLHRLYRYQPLPLKISFICMWPGRPSRQWKHHQAPLVRHIPLKYNTFTSHFSQLVNVWSMKKNPIKDKTCCNVVTFWR